MFHQLNAYLLARFYDRAMLCPERLYLGQWRSELLAKASGQFLEIGAGIGVNLAYYPPETCLTLCEPDHHMRRRLAEKTTRPDSSPLQLTAWQAEAIPLPDASLDTIVSTLVLCSVADLQRSVEEIHRLLRPGGRLLFIEHVLAREAQLIRWQKRLNPLWKRCRGNCHLARDTAGALAADGFTLAELVEAPLRGVAVKPGNQDCAPFEHNSVAGGKGQ